MRLHPALKAAKAELRKNGIQTLPVGSLALHVICRDYNERALIIDIRISNQQDGLARFEIPFFNDHHTMYKQLQHLHHQTFEYAI